MIPRIFRDQNRAGHAVTPLTCFCNEEFQTWSGSRWRQTAKLADGARASRAKASEKPTFTAVPSASCPAREGQHLRRPDPGAGKRPRLGGDIRAFQNEEREALPPREVIAIGNTELLRRLLPSFSGSATVRTRGRIGNLDVGVMGAPWMAIARAYREAEPAIESAAASRSRTAWTMWSSPRGISAISLRRTRSA